MSVIVEVSLTRDGFTLGRILPDLDDVEYTLEAIVPLGEAPIPFIRVHDGNSDTLVAAVMDHPAVRGFELQSDPGDEEMYRLDWDFSSDAFLDAIHESGGTFSPAKATVNSGNSLCSSPITTRSQSSTSGSVSGTLKKKSCRWRIRG